MCCTRRGRRNVRRRRRDRACAYSCRRVVLLLYYYYNVVLYVGVLFAPIMRAEGTQCVHSRVFSTLLLLLSSSPRDFCRKNITSCASVFPKTFSDAVTDPYIFFFYYNYCFLFFFCQSRHSSAIASVLLVFVK